MSWEEQVAWAGDMATEVGSGRTACMSSTKEKLCFQLNLGNFTDHRVEEEKGVPDVSLTLKKCIPSV